MANPSWPTTLPPMLQSGASVKPAVDNVIKTGMETGAPKRRRRFTWVPDTVTVTLCITSAQKSTLETFKRTTVSDVLPFDYVDPFTGGSKTYVFDGDIAYSANDGEYDSWNASFKLESRT